MSEHALKTKAERVQEAVQIMMGLKKFGIVVSEPGYKATKKALDEWIATGHSQPEQLIPFPRHGRTAHMTLPAKHILPAIYVLKAQHTPTLEEQEAE